MRLNDMPGEHYGGIVNYFQGATINNLVINGNMTKSASENFNNYPAAKENTATVSADTVVQAVNQCGKLFWGTAALATVFCVCRDIYGWQDNAAKFERIMNEHGINCPPGTIANTMRNNPYMKMPLTKWGNNGAMERVMKLVSVFRQSVDDLMNGK